MFPPSTPPPQTPPHKPHTPPPEEKAGWGKYLGWIFIVAGLIAIIAIGRMNYHEPRLTCRDTGNSGNSLTKMGTCSEE